MQKKRRLITPYAINLGKGIEMKNLDKKNVRILSLSIPLTFPQPRILSTLYRIVEMQN